MEVESITISKKAPSSQALNFDALRTLAIEHIQKVAGKVWTDHNLHDPGITTLEVLAYAITDISSRANTSIENIVASATKDAQDIFYTAAEILPCHPVSINDFRKILIDLESIRNAWLEPAEEHEVTMKLEETTGVVDFENGETIHLRGLYNVLLEFNETEISTGNPANPTKVVDINKSVLQHPTINVLGTPIAIEIAFPYWDQMPDDWGTDLVMDEVLLEDIDGQKLVTLDEEQNEDFFGVLVVQYNAVNTHKMGIRIKVNTRDHGLAEVDLKTGIIDTLEITAAEIAGDSSIIDTSLIKEFNFRVIAALEVIKTVKTYIHDYRNLCEDFYSFRSIRVQEIVLNTELEIYSNTNVEKLLAQLLFEISQFLSPAVNFLTLEEMLDRDIPAEKIFEGPLLEHGFIPDEDLNDLKRSEIVYTSDLVRIILAQNTDLLQVYSNKIISVNNLTLSNFINNQLLNTNVRNCLKLTQPETYKPRLSVEKSQIKVIRSGIEISYDFAEVIDTYNQLKLQSMAASSGISVNDLPIPTGKDLNIEEYYSIQHDFPLTYGVGEEGVPGLSAIKDEAARNFRLAQANQFKGYLLFFEQILANYLSQLRHVGDLFSYDPSIVTTYFSQPLYDVPEVQRLLKDFNGSGLSWSDFKQDLDNDYISYLEQSGNEEKTTQERKNRFLDHMLARFSEEFVEYALLQAKQPDGIGLINDKSAFLSTYPMLSSQRFKAFNYLKQLETSTGPDVWGTNNVAGVQKRIAGKLGIKCYKRRNLFVSPSTFMSVVPSGADFIIELKDDNGLLIFSSIPYASSPLATAAIDDLISFGLFKKNYQIFKDAGTSMYRGALLDNGGTVLGRVEGTYNNRKNALEAVDVVFNFFQEKYSAEGLFLIEHILLRAKRKDVPASGGPVSDKLLSGFPNTIDGYIEPYSFCVSVILPAGLTDTVPPVKDLPERFGDDDFRTFAEKIIRRELPAHVKADIYWATRDAILAFEPIYQTWLETVADSSSTEEELVLAQNDLIDQLNIIYSNV